MQYPMATIKIGEKETTLMRINSKILLELMDHDEQLALSIRSLLLKSLQRKVGHLLNAKATDMFLPGESQAIYEIRR
jgi:CRP-like cAMP-binding protein